jgi:hypothetical protein
MWLRYNVLRANTEVCHARFKIPCANKTKDVYMFCVCTVADIVGVLEAKFQCYSKTYRRFTLRYAFNHSSAAAAHVCLMKVYETRALFKQLLTIIRVRLESGFSIRPV